MGVWLLSVGVAAVVGLVVGFLVSRGFIAREDSPRRVFWVTAVSVAVSGALAFAVMAALLGP